ncbi:hypothetical protein Aau02nite_91290 [Amorphoplanes auranticolor]|uniref:Uncharacterized protein n=1 Tax=Actinoplanes auranticolor TaxID=47988 RepID=A0A919SYC8_9ACTN|nr:hypothetical protein Aau02nite_91290 [Actinoplanes auranticolor]
MLGERDGRETELHRAGAGPFHGALGSIPGEFGVYVTVCGLNHLATVAIMVQALRSGWACRPRHSGSARDERRAWKICELVTNVGLC